MPEAARNLENHDQQRNPQQERSNSINKEKLTPSELTRVEKGQTTIDKLALERRVLKLQAEAQIDKFSKDKVIDSNEYRNLKKELEDEESPEKTKEILERIKEIPKEKEKAEVINLEERKELSPEDPKLLDLQKEFDNACDKNRRFIGRNEVSGFKAWFAKERRSKPTVAHLKDILKRFYGKDSNDRNGLAPRRKEYNNLRRIYKKYGLNRNDSSPWVMEQGLSERIQFRDNAEKLEKRLALQKDTGRYSKKVLTEIMQEVLKAKNPHEQKELFKKVNKITELEASGITAIQASTKNIAGRDIRKMSKKSEKLYFEYYKDVKLTANGNEREKLIGAWKILIDHEGDLLTDLEKIYKNDKDGLLLALESFESLDFLTKERALKAHKHLVDSNESKDIQHKKLIRKAAETKGEEAISKGVFNSKTQKKYKEWFANDDNFKNPKTRKPGDNEELKKAYETFIGNSPDYKSINIAAYAAKRKNFKSKLRDLQNVDPSLKKEDIQKWQEKYDREGWSKRKKVHMSLKDQIRKKSQEKQKQSSLENKAGISEGKKGETEKNLSENITSLEELRTSTKELLQDNQVQQALLLLSSYKPKSEHETKEVAGLIKLAADWMEKFGIGESFDDEMDQELEKETDKILETDETLKDKIEEEQIKTINIDAAKNSEAEFNKTVSAQDRNRKKSLNKITDKDKRDLAESFYELTDDKHILDENLSGEKIDEIKFNDTVMTDQERQRLKEKTRKGAQEKLMRNEGSETVSFKDKSGRSISAEEAKTHQEKDLQKLENELAQKALQKSQNKRAADKPKGSVINLQDRVAAKRKARTKIDTKRNENIRA